MSIILLTISELIYPEPCFYPCNKLRVRAEQANLGPDDIQWPTMLIGGLLMVSVIRGSRSAGTALGRMEGRKQPKRVKVSKGKIR